MKRILIVEDNSRHMKDALEILKNVDDLEIVTATNVKEATEKLGEMKFDGVISDVFMPMVGEENADNPCGLAVAMMAFTIGIKCVFCTDQYHHSESFEPINTLFNSLRKPLDCMWGEKIIDSPRKESKKNWLGAYEHLFDLENEGGCF